MEKIDTLLLQHLGQFVSDHKKELVETILQARTRHITVVLEGIHNSQNTSAAIRTCECFGIQDIHIIETNHPYEINPYVLKGSKKWVNVTTYPDGQTPVWHEKLRAEGYRIFATSPSADATPIYDIDLSQKFAIVFGNELEGVSKETLQMADGCVTIPMVGFTESLNISASVAICLSTWITKLKTMRLDVGITREEMDAIRLDWFRRMVKRSDLIEAEFLRSIH